MSGEIIQFFQFLRESLAIGFSWVDLMSFVLQCLILGIALIYAYLQIKGTQAERILNGILILGILVILIYIFNLVILIKIFELLLPAILTVMIVLFAPEVRSFLQALGKEGLAGFGLVKTFRDFITTPDQGKNNQEVPVITQEIVKAIEILSRNKFGALLVFDSTWSDGLYVSSGRRLDAIISTELLLNIFYPKSPLHDGAVLILNRRIYSASVILPITQNPKLNPWQYGTRHRAALGISENSKTCFCLVVSEETGSISVAENGKIIKMSLPEIVNKLNSFLSKT